MNMVSYAQNHEDVLLDRLFPRGLPGFYIDVGANDPVRHSITKHFSDLGWRGINVEPASQPFERLREARERDVNLNVGVSDTEGSLTLFEFPDGLSGSSTFSADQASFHKEKGLAFAEREVAVMTLAQICEEHVEGDIDFISIDVEGYERQVIAGGDWKRWRPKVVVVEATQPNTKIPTHEQWEPMLVDSGYLFAAFDGLNRYYVREEDHQLSAALETPANVTDDFLVHEYSNQIQTLSWNFEAVRKQLAAARGRSDSLEAGNDELVRQSRAFARQLSSLRSQYERLERSLTNARAQVQAAGLDVENTAALCEELRQEVVRVRAQAETTHQLFEGVGPAGLGVARRLGRLHRKLPRVAAAAERSARLALAVKRRISGNK